VSINDQIRQEKAIPPRFSRLRGYLLVGLLMAGGPAMAGDPSASTQSKPANPWTMCAKATNLIERQEGIPRQLLRAISKIESGRLHPRKKIVMAWPWTVMAEGRGRYLANKEEAIAEVEALLDRGVSNIDVGCMQINLRYHPQAFRDLDEAFDPIANVGYSATFLKSLVAEHRTWSKAVAHYHSANPERYLTYRAKVKQAWRAERMKYLAALEQATVAAQVEQASADSSRSASRPVAIAAYAGDAVSNRALPHHPPVSRISPATPVLFAGTRFAHAGPLPAHSRSNQANFRSEPAFSRAGPVESGDGV
jgi:hypothetical protein